MPMPSNELMRLPEAGKYANHVRARSQASAGRGSNIEQGAKVFLTPIREEEKAFDALPKLLRLGIMYAEHKYSAKKLYDDYWQLRRQGFEQSQVVTHIFQSLTRYLGNDEVNRILQRHEVTGNDL